MGERRDKREVIMKAAEALFEARRFHEITMDDIAQRAKVGKGTIYRYFADKEALFFEVAAAGYDALCALVDHHAAETTDFRQSLARVCEAVGGFLRRRHRLWHMMQMEDRRQLCRHGRGRDAWMERRGRLGEALSGIVRGGVASGWIRTDIPAESLAMLLFGMLRAAAHASEAEMISYERLADVFVTGARAPEPEGACR